MDLLGVRVIGEELAATTRCLAALREERGPAKLSGAPHQAWVTVAAVLALAAGGHG